MEIMKGLLIDSDIVIDYLRGLNNFQISLVTPSIAKLAGELRRDYSRPFADMLVASSALLYNFILATRNAKHFKDITDLKILRPY